MNKQEMHKGEMGSKEIINGVNMSEFMFELKRLYERGCRPNSLKLFGRRITIGFRDGKIFTITLNDETDDDEVLKIYNIMKDAFGFSD